MTKQELLSILETIISEARAAVLSTVDNTGRPMMRWMTPAILGGGALYAVTSPRFAKVTQVRKNPLVSWMFQTATLNTIVTIQGRMNILENPSIRMEVLEILGSRLQTFWKVNQDERDLVVLETVIEEASCFFPLIGERRAVTDW